MILSRRSDRANQGTLRTYLDDDRDDGGEQADQRSRYWGDHFDAAKYALPDDGERDKPTEKGACVADRHLDKKPHRTPNTRGQRGICFRHMTRKQLGCDK